MAQICLWIGAFALLSWLDEAAGYPDISGHEMLGCMAMVYLTIAFFRGCYLLLKNRKLIGNALADAYIAFERTWTAKPDPTKEPF